MLGLEIPAYRRYHALKGNIIRIECEYTGGSGRFRRPGGLYWADLDAGNRWLIERAGIRDAAEGNEETVQVTYGSSSNDLPVPVSVKYVHLFKKNGFRQETISEVDTSRGMTHREEEFFLLYYGFPESVVGDETNWGTAKRILWAVGGALSFLLCRSGF